LYVRQCEAPTTPGTRPITCAGIQDTIWTSSDSTSIGQGAIAFSGKVTLPVHRTFTAGNAVSVDCEAVICGVLVRRDHLGPTDTSLDTFIPISFATVFSVSLSKTAQLANAGEQITIAISGLTTDQGVYARLCAQATTQGARPTLCDGQGAWASLSPAMIAVGAVDGSKPIVLTAKASFNAGPITIDCKKVTCGIFVRRDHLDPTDMSLDTFVPITFADALITSPEKSVTSILVKNRASLTIVGYKGQKLTITVGSSAKSLVANSNRFNFSTTLPKGKKTRIKLDDGKNNIFVKTFSN
jgi:hypothetical protein